MDKQALVDAVLASLRAELATAERVARETAAAANHPEARPENDKDTRKIELSYLAAGQAARARELEAGIALLANVPLAPLGDGERIRLGALVVLDVGGESQRVLLVPAGGGTKLASPDGEVSLVTPQSPLGRELVGKVVGDGFELRTGGRVRDVEIVAAV